MFAATRGRGARPATPQSEHSNSGWRSPHNLDNTGNPWRGRPSPRRDWSSRGFPSRGGFSGTWRAVRSPQEPAKDFLDGLRTKPIQEFKYPQPVDAEEIAMKDVRYLASYSWKECPQPTIIVPGSPRVWRDRQLPFSVPPDSGTTYAYSNGLRAPDAPLLPIFLAVDRIAEDSNRDQIDWSTIDIVTDRNNLRKLLGWIQPLGSVAEEFRIDLQLCGMGTVLMQRWEPRSTYNAEWSGFGDSFERETTTAGPDCEEGTLAGHHRIISYDFHGLKLLLRCEVDAFLPSESSTTTSEDAEAADEAQDDPDSALLEAFSSLTVSDGVSNPTETSSTEIQVVTGGSEVPQWALIKIKSRSERNAATFDWASAYVQLYLRQTPNVFTGIHRKGNFFEVRKKNLDSPEMLEVKKSAQVILKQLRRLLEEIQYHVMHHDTAGRLSLVCQNGGLKLYERENDDSFLPDNILARFD